MKKVYVIEKVSIKEVPENDTFWFVKNQLSAYTPDALIPIPNVFDEVKSASLIEINDRKNPPVTVAFIPGCEHADFVTDSIEKLIRNTEELHRKTDQLNFRIKENTELQFSVKNLTDSVEKMSRINTVLSGIECKHEKLKSSFWKRFKFLFFPN